MEGKIGGHRPTAVPDALATGTIIQQMAAKPTKPVRPFKKGIDADDARRRRGELGVELRKTRRDIAVGKKRMSVGGTVVSIPNITTFVSVPDTTTTGIQTTGIQPTGIQTTGIQPTVVPASIETDVGPHRLASVEAARSILASIVKKQDPVLANQLKILPAVIEALNHPTDVKTQTAAVVEIRRWLSFENRPPIQEIVDCRVVPRLVYFLTKNDQPTLQFEACWTLTNIASGTTQHAKSIVDAGAIPILIGLLRLAETTESVQTSIAVRDVCEQATWTVGNIAGDNADFRDRILKAGALPKLIGLVDQAVPTKLPRTIIRNIAWTISNLCRGKPPPDFEQVRSALPAMAKLIQTDDVEILIDVCWTLSYLSDDSSGNQRIQAVIQTNITQRLVGLLSHNDANIRTPALRTIGNLVTGDDLQTDVVLKAGVLPQLLRLLSNNKKAIRKDACWTISNLLAGNCEQIQTVFNANIVPSLMLILKNADFDVRKEAAWSIYNATTGGTTEQIRYLVQQGMIPPMADLLRSPDARIVMMSMEAIENVLKVGKTDANAKRGPNEYADYLEECGGLDLLENLQRHDNEDIYQKSGRMLRDYFESTDSATNDVVADPTVSNDGSSFAFG